MSAGAASPGGLEEAAELTVASLPGCEHRRVVRYEKLGMVDSRGIPVQAPVWTDPCPHRATVRLKSKNVDLGWADQTSPGWLTCDEHEVGADPDREREELPQAKLVRLVEGRKA